MMNSKRRQIGILLAGSVIAGLLLLHGSGVMIGRQENQDDNQLELGIWTADMRFEQTFIASQDNLCRLDIFVDSYRPWDSPYLDCFVYEIGTTENLNHLSYELIKANRKEIRHIRLNGWLISAHMFNSVSFAPIPDSMNKRYLFSIQSPELKTGGSSILLASPGERYEYGNLFVNGEKKEGDLAFRALYAQPKTQIIQQSVARMSLRKPFPFSYPIAYYVMFIGYFVLLLAFLGMIL